MIKKAIPPRNEVSIKNNTVFFDFAPIALKVEDFSEVKKHFDSIAVNDIKSYLNNNPKERTKIVSLIRVKNINTTAIKLYKARSKEELLENFNKTATQESIYDYTKLVVELLQGKKEIEIKTLNNTIYGEEFDVLLKFKVVDGSEKTLENVVVSIEDITERFLEEQSSKIISNILKNTLSSIEDGLVILDHDSNYLYINDKAEKLLGKKHEYLIGKNIWIEFPEKEGDLFFDSYQEAFKTRKPIGLKNYFKPWKRWFENRIIPSKDGILIVFHDITVTKRYEYKLKTAYNIINKGNSVAFLGKNRKDFPIIFVSENVYDLFGYTPDEFLKGKVKTNNVIHKDDILKLRNDIAYLIKANNETTFKLAPIRIITKDKIEKWVQINIDFIKSNKNEITHIQAIAEDVTENKNTQDLFYKSNQRITGQFNNTALASIMWDLEFNVTEWNNSAHRIFGYTAEQAKRSDIKNLITPPHLISEMKKISENLLNRSDSFRNINQNVTKKGKIITCEWYNVPLKDLKGKVIGVSSLVNDITERVKKAELENVLYNISNESLRNSNFTQFGFFIKNELHKIIDTNNFYIALYNEETDTFKTPVFVDSCENVIEEFPASNTLTGHVIKTKKPLLVNSFLQKELIEKDELEVAGPKAKIWVGVPLTIKEKIFGVIAVQNYEDEEAYNEDDVHLLEFVADQISAVIQRKNYERELKEALAKAQESDRLKSSFLANMSHEIRTPMNGIIGFSELFLDKDITEQKRQEYAKVVINSSKQLLSIVNDVLDISKIESGTVTLNNEKVNINQLLDDLYVFYKPIAEEHKINLECIKTLQDEKCIIEIDKVKLNQIIINLLSNAFKFTKEGFIKFGYKVIEGNLQFYVKDTGVGIDEELQNKIFDRFTQVESDLNKLHKGTGLGLAISKSFVKLFKGKFWLESSKKGSTFYFTIPFLEKEVVQDITPPSKIATIPSVTNELTILIAEDEVYNRLYMKELFSKTNYKILEANNGKEAVELVNKFPEIDLVLMDIKMPIMNGKEAMKLIKSYKPNIPIIALSAFAMESEKVIAIKFGFDAYLTKPLSKRRLFNLIEKYTSTIE